MSNQDLTPDCGRIRNELPGLLYGELAGEARSAVEQHLSGCTACREEQATLAETRALLARWETPSVAEDPRAVAREIREIAALARQRSRPRTRNRLVRLGAALAGAAAALLFLLGLLGTRASFADGRFQISFALPGAAGTLDAGDLEQRVRSLVAEEVSTHAASLQQDQDELLQRCSLMSREEMQKELLRLSRAVDLARAEDRRAFDTRLASFGREAALADQEQRQVITDLASLVVPVSNVNR